MPTARDAAHPVRTGAWRSVLNSQHGFFKESFIDEMAHAAGKDPYRFRLDLLNHAPLFRDVLERVAALSGWGSPLPEGEGRGIAITQCFGSIVAEVAHVAVTPEGKLRVRDVFAVVDCGDVVNTDSAAAQAEGGIIFGLSAALAGEITIAEGRVVQSNFQGPPDDPPGGRASNHGGIHQNRQATWRAGRAMRAAHRSRGSQCRLRGDRHPRARSADQEHAAFAPDQNVGLIDLFAGQYAVASAVTTA